MTPLLTETNLIFINFYLICVNITYKDEIKLITIKKLILISDTCSHCEHVFSLEIT